MSEKEDGGLWGIGMLHVLNELRPTCTAPGLFGSDDVATMGGQRAIAMFPRRYRSFHITKVFGKPLAYKCV